MNKSRAKFNLVMTDSDADEALVQLTAQMMRAKLADARGKGRGLWWDRDMCNNHDLQMILEDHVAKIYDLPITDPERLRLNFIDIANISAMMAIRTELYGEDA